MEVSPSCFQTPQILNITESIPSVKRRERSRSVTFKTWVRFPSAPPRDYMSFSEIWNGPSFLNRSAVARRMKARDEAGKSSKKTKKHYKEHYRKDWDKDLWD